MDGKENIPVSKVRNSIELLQKERSKVELYLHELIEVRKLFEEKVNKADSKLAKLSDEQNGIEESKAILAFKVEKLEKDANQWDDKNKNLRETIENIQLKIDGYKEKRELELEKFEKEAVKLCELFSSATVINDDDTIKAETSKVYEQIAQIQAEYGDTKLELGKCRSELDDIVLYQVPRNPKEMEIPLVQRKMVLKIFEDALMKVRAQIENLNRVKKLKAEEFEKLPAM